MGIGKRTLRVSKKELKELFELPEGIEILSVRASKGFPDGEAIEFLLVSPEEVEINGHKVTVEHKDDDYGLIRTLGLSTLKKIVNGEEIHTGGYINDWHGHVGIITNPPKIEPIFDGKKLAEEILKGVKKTLEEDKKNNSKFKRVVKDNLTFGDAINALHDGKKVTRAIWQGYWVIEDNEEFGEIIVAYLRDGSKAVASPYNADMLAIDWQVVE